MNKTIVEAKDEIPVDEQDAVLSKYKKPARLQNEEKQQEDELTKKRLIKERQRLMGRVIPTEEGVEYEREL